jgi:MYXO-CTERM domain-containing protein
MRALPPAAALAAAAVLALLPSASGQADGCVEADPCPWLVEVDAHGFVGDSAWNFTQGDWYTLSVGNSDTAPHSVTLALPGREVTVAAGPESDAESAPFNFTAAGTFRLATDHGHQGTVRVVAADVVDYEQGVADESGNPRTSTTSKGTPGPALAWAAAGLAAALLARRRPRA